MEELVHYGYSYIRKSLIKGVINSPYGRNKPLQGGLWTSPMNSEYGWKDYCKSEDHDADLGVYCTVTLKDDAKVLTIDGDDAKVPMIEKGVPHSRRKYPDFEEIAKHYDAIHLTAKGERETRFSDKLNFYGWDCETVLILNPDAIKE